MKIQIHAVHFTADQKLLEFIHKKVDKLETFYDQLLDGEVFLRLDKGEHARENKFVEIKINIPGSQLFAKDSSTSFEAAADSVVESLRSQLVRHKDKAYAKH